MLVSLWLCESYRHCPRNERDRSRVVSKSFTSFLPSFGPRGHFGTGYCVRTGGDCRVSTRRVLRSMRHKVSLYRQSVIQYKPTSGTLYLNIWNLPQTRVQVYSLNSEFPVLSKASSVSLRLCPSPPRGVTEDPTTQWSLQVSVR